MATLKHSPNWSKRTNHEYEEPEIPRSQLYNFARDYLDACFEDREVSVIPKYRDELDRFLW